MIETNLTEFFNQTVPLFDSAPARIVGTVNGSPLDASISGNLTVNSYLPAWDLSVQLQIIDTVVLILIALMMMILLIITITRKEV